MGYIIHPEKRYPGNRDIEYRVGDKGCWIVVSHAVSDSQGGYPQMRVKGKNIRLHRFSYEKHKGSIPQGLCVCHSCDNRLCINPDHLFLGTVDDNNQDMKIKGRNQRGSRHRFAKVDEDQVLEIRQLYREGVIQKTIAGRFGLARQSISDIVRGKNWAWLKGESNVRD